MSIEDYKDWKEGRYWGYLSRTKLDFWNTKPSMEQERLVSQRCLYAYIGGVVVGLALGIFIGLIL